MNFHLIQRKALPTNYFELTVPDLFNIVHISCYWQKHTYIPNVTNNCVTIAQKVTNHLFLELLGDKSI